MDNGPQLHVSEEYRKIADRLKKKMFRKIPYASVSDLFTKLSIDLQRTGQKHYSAQCMLSAAKCEELNRTPLHAAYFYLNAGRVFTHTSMSEKQIKYFTAEEFVTEAMDAFKNSIEIYETHVEYSMCATLCFELAQMLFILDKFEESGTYFMKSFAYASPTYNFLNPDDMDGNGDVDLLQQHNQQQQYGRQQQQHNQQQQQQHQNGTALSWQEKHHLLFSQNHSTTQMQSLRNAVNSYLKTNDYEIVTQILQLQQTLLTQQYQTLISSLLASLSSSSSSPSSDYTISSNSTGNSNSNSNSSSSNDLFGFTNHRQRSGSITLLQQQYTTISSGSSSSSSSSGNNSKTPQFNSMASLLFTQRINIHVTLLLVLLIQKRKKESVECMEDLLTTLNSEYEQSNTTTFFKDNILPLIEELYDACINDRVTHVVFIVEQQILHHSFDDNQIGLLDDLRHVYENPLFLE